jgi:type II secretory pathway component GspD/PulD (secretin)
MTRWVLIGGLAWLLLAALCSGVAAQEAGETVAQIVPLKFASAHLVAAAFGKDGTEEKLDVAADRKEFVRRALEDATRHVRPMPEMGQPGIYPFAERSYAEVKVAQAGPLGQRGAMASLLPEGLSEPPTALPQQNALVVKGTPDAIDEFREIVALIDKPAKQVNVELKLVNIRESAGREWGADIDWRGSRGDVSIHGPAPLGPTLRFGTAGVNALLALNEATARSNDTVAASVTTTNNTPCVIRAATVIPFIAASITYDQFGQRRIDYAVDSVLTGVELFTVPRIIGDDRVAMLLRPSFIDKTGQVTGPDGSVIPITQEVATETTIVVPDGETMLVGGLPRSLHTLESVGLPVIFRQSGTIEDVESLIFVTPRIVRSAGG